MSAYAPLGGIPAVTQGQEQLNQNALAEYTRAAQEKQQTALTAQQTQQAALETQQKQIQLQDQQALNKAMQGWDGKDPSALLQTAKQNGLSANGYLQGQQAVLARQQQLATLSKSQLDLMNEHHDAALGVLDAAKQVPDEQLPQHIADSVQQLQAQGHLSPQEAAQVTQHSQSMPPDQFRPWLDVYEKGLMGEKTQIANAASAAKASEDAAKARSENATAAHQEFVNGLSKNSKPGDFDSQVDAILPPSDKLTAGPNQYTKALVNGALSRGDLPGAQKVMDQALQSQLGVAKDIAVGTNPQIQAGKVAVAGATAAARQKAQLGDWGEPGDPAIDMVGQGRVDLTTMMSRVPPAARDKFLTNLASAYPQYEQQVYQTRQAEQKAFTSGSQGQQLTAINTARNHMQTFKNTADALDNGDFLLANKVGNELGMQFGSDKATNFNIAKSAFAGEVGKAFAGANVGVQDRQELMDKISAASSPAQLKGYADTADELLAGKQKSLKQSYDQGIQGKANFGAGNQGGDFFSKFGGKARPQSQPNQ
jgi:hypothetical protein